MRRSASDIIRNLEMRVARLEKQSRSNPTWDKSLRQIVDYFTTNVGKNFRGTDFEIDVRKPSSYSKLRGNKNTATLVFILNGEAVYLETYEHLNMFGKPLFGFFLMDGESNRVSKELKPGEVIQAKPLVPVITKILKGFVEEVSNSSETLNDLYRELQDDFIDANKVADLLRQLFTGSDLKQAFRLAKETQGRNPYDGAKALWEGFVVVKMRDQIREARIPTTL